MANPRVDLVHRDAQLALGTTGDLIVVIALTRFDALGEVLGAELAGYPKRAAGAGGAPQH